MTPHQIKAVRRKLKMSRRQFAAALGVSNRTVEGWELGVKPSTLALKLIATLQPSPRT